MRALAARIEAPMRIAEPGSRFAPRIAELGPRSA
jgi:hypothetical protein